MLTLPDALDIWVFWVKYLIAFILHPQTVVLSHQDNVYKNGKKCDLKMVGSSSMRSWTKLSLRWCSDGCWKFRCDVKPGLLASFQIRQTQIGHKVHLFGRENYLINKTVVPRLPQTPISQHLNKHAQIMFTTFLECGTVLPMFIHIFHCLHDEKGQVQ